MKITTFKLSKDYFSLFQEAMTGNNVERMSQIFEEMTTELGVHPNPAGTAPVMKRLAEKRNAEQNKTSFEGSVPGKKI